MGEIDKRGILDDEPFSYRALKDGKLLIYWHDRHVTTLAGNAAAKLLSRVENADAPAVQLALAKATGDFKRGNER